MTQRGAAAAGALGGSRGRGGRRLRGGVRLAARPHPRSVRPRVGDRPAAGRLAAVEGCAGVFERFTPQARQVVTLALEEARALAHDAIAAEHVLLGLLREGDGLAAAVLSSRGVTADDARREIVRIGVVGDAAGGEWLPFTQGARDARAR